MASSSHCGGGDDNAEVFTLEMKFQDFVNKCNLPAIVLISSGSYLSESVQISKGNILTVKSCDRQKVTLSYWDNRSKQQRKASVSLNSDLKFFALPAKDCVERWSSEESIDSGPRSRSSSIVTYPTVSDLLIDCPTFFEATAGYDDPYLPGLTIHKGEKFRFVRTRTGRGGYQDLEVEDCHGNRLVLTSGCRGDFRPLTDHRLYTLRELVNLAPVQRRLRLARVSTSGDDSRVLAASSDALDRSPASGKGDEGECGAEYSLVSKAKHHSRSNSLPVNSNDAHDEAPSQTPSPDRLNESSEKVKSIRSPSSNTMEPCYLPTNGPINLLHPEPVVLASPYGDEETIWEIPLSANIQVKLYSPSDYEVPQRSPNQGSMDHQMHFSTLPMSPTMPEFPAPKAPPLQQPIVPLAVASFADIYAESLPAKASILDTLSCDEFWQEALKHAQDANVYRIEDEARLYVKDSKSDDVYSLSSDLDISFVEYPEKFSMISELVGLPIGTEVAILEDIASDYPKPFSLRFGDVIKISSITSQFVKMKYGNRDCEVLKVEKLDPNGENLVKLKLPLDFDVQMTMSTGSSSPKILSLQDILSGHTKIPSRIVASFPGEPGKHKDVLKILPVDVQILKALKQSVLIMAPVCDSKKIPEPPPSVDSDSSSCSDQASFSRRRKRSFEPAPPNIGLPMTSGAVLAFRGRLDISEMDLVEYNADYLRLPLEKLTMPEFEERERHIKLTMDYEDIERGRGSDASLDKCGAGALHRTNSAGTLDRQEKRSKVDRVRRLSRALNPKHWRNIRQEPEPLPPPSAMGLLALAARPSAARNNHYDDRIEHHHQQQPQHERSGKSGSIHSGSTNTGESSGEEEENFYEDVEIGPIKSSTMKSSASGQRKGPFSDFLHKSMPSPRRRPKLPFRARAKRTESGRNAAADDDDDEDDQTLVAEGGHSSVIAPGADSAGKVGKKEADPGYDVPRHQPLDKAIRWAHKLGDKITARYDIPRARGGRGKDGKDETDADIPGMCKIHQETAHHEGAEGTTASHPSPPIVRAPSPPILPPPRTTSLEEPEPPPRTTSLEDPDSSQRNASVDNPNPPPRTTSLEDLDSPPRVSTLPQGLAASQANPLPDPPPRNTSLGTSAINVQGQISDTMKAKEDEENGPIAPARRKRASKVPQAFAEFDRETHDPALPQSSHPDKSNTRLKKSPNKASQDNGGWDSIVKVQPRPRNSLLRLENPKSNESMSKEDAVPPRPKPRGLKSQVSFESASTKTCDETNDVMRGELQQANRMPKIAPPVKPRSTQ